MKQIPLRWFEKVLIEKRCSYDSPKPFATLDKWYNFCAEEAECNKVSTYLQDSYTAYFSGTKSDGITLECSKSTVAFSCFHALNRPVEENLHKKIDKRKHEK